MNRFSFVGGVLLFVLGAGACSSESTSSSTPSSCEAAFTKLCDKAASCSPTGKVTFVSASSGDAGGGGSSISMKTAGDCKSLYTLGCGSQPPANVPACSTAVEAAKCSTQASGEAALVYPVECKQ